MCDMQKMPSREDASCEEDSDMNFATFSAVGAPGTHFVTTGGQLPVTKIQQNVSNNGTGMQQVCVAMGDGGVQYMRALDAGGSLQAAPQLISVPIALPGAKPGDPQPTVQIQVLNPNLLQAQQQPKYQMQIPIQGFQQGGAVLTLAYSPENEAGGIQLVGQGSLGEGLQVLATLPHEMQLVQPTQDKDHMQNMHQVFITPNQQIIINGPETKTLNNNTTSDNNNAGMDIIIKEECDDTTNDDESSQGTETSDSVQWQLGTSHQQDLVKYLNTLPPQQTQALPASLQQFLRKNPTDVKSEPVEIDIDMDDVGTDDKKEEPVAEAVLSEGLYLESSSEQQRSELDLQDYVKILNEESNDTFETLKDNFPKMKSPAYKNEYNVKKDVSMPSYFGKQSKKLSIAEPSYKAIDQSIDKVDPVTNQSSKQLTEVFPAPKKTRNNKIKNLKYVSQPVPVTEPYETIDLVTEDYPATNSMPKAVKSLQRGVPVKNITIKAEKPSINVNQHSVEPVIQFLPVFKKPSLKVLPVLNAPENSVSHESQTSSPLQYIAYKKVKPLAQVRPIMKDDCNPTENTSVNNKIVASPTKSPPALKKTRVQTKDNKGNKTSCDTTKPQKEDSSKLINTTLKPAKVSPLPYESKNLIESSPKAVLPSKSTNKTLKPPKVSPLTYESKNLIESSPKAVLPSKLTKKTLKPPKVSPLTYESKNPIESSPKAVPPVPKKMHEPSINSLISYPSNHIIEPPKAPPLVRKPKKQTQNKSEYLPYKTIETFPESLLIAKDSFEKTDFNIKMIPAYQITEPHSKTLESTKPIKHSSDTQTVTSKSYRQAEFNPDNYQSFQIIEPVQGDFSSVPTDTFSTECTEVSSVTYPAYQITESLPDTLSAANDLFQKAKVNSDEYPLETIEPLPLSETFPVTNVTFDQTGNNIETFSSYQSFQTLSDAFPVTNKALERPNVSSESLPLSDNFPLTKDRLEPTQGIPKAFPLFKTLEPLSETFSVTNDSLDRTSVNSATLQQYEIIKPLPESVSCTNDSIVQNEINNKTYPSYRTNNPLPEVVFGTNKSFETSENNPVIYQLYENMEQDVQVLANDTFESNEIESQTHLSSKPIEPLAKVLPTTDESSVDPSLYNSENYQTFQIIDPSPDDAIANETYEFTEIPPEIYESYETMGKEPGVANESYNPSDNNTVTNNPSKYHLYKTDALPKINESIAAIDGPPVTYQSYTNNDEEQTEVLSVINASFDATDSPSMAGQSYQNLESLPELIPSSNISHAPTATYPSFQIIKPAMGIEDPLVEDHRVNYVTYGNCEPQTEALSESYAPYHTIDAFTNDAKSYTTESPAAVQPGTYSPHESVGSITQAQSTTSIFYQTTKHVTDVHPEIYQSYETVELTEQQPATYQQYEMVQQITGLQTAKNEPYDTTQQPTSLQSNANRPCETDNQIFIEQPPFHPFETDQNPPELQSTTNQQHGTVQLIEQPLATNQLYKTVEQLKDQYGTVQNISEQSAANQQPETVPQPLSTNQLYETVEQLQEQYETVQNISEQSAANQQPGTVPQPLATKQLYETVEQLEEQYETVQKISEQSAANQQPETVPQPLATNQLYETVEQFEEQYETAQNISEQSAANQQPGTVPQPLATNQLYETVEQLEEQYETVQNISEQSAVNQQPGTVPQPLATNQLYETVEQLEEQYETVQNMSEQSAANQQPGTVPQPLSTNQLYETVEQLQEQYETVQNISEQSAANQQPGTIPQPLATNQLYETVEQLEEKYETVQNISEQSPANQQPGIVPQPLATNQLYETVEQLQEQYETVQNISEQSAANQQPGTVPQPLATNQLYETVEQLEEQYETVQNPSELESATNAQHEAVPEFIEQPLATNQLYDTVENLKEQYETVQNSSELASVPNKQYETVVQLSETFQQHDTIRNPSEHQSVSYQQYETVDQLSGKPATYQQYKPMQNLPEHQSVINQQFDRVPQLIEQPVATNQIYETFEQLSDKIQRYENVQHITEQPLSTNHVYESAQHLTELQPATNQQYEAIIQQITEQFGINQQYETLQQLTELQSDRNQLYETIEPQPGLEAVSYQPYEMLEPAMQIQTSYKTADSILDSPSMPLDDLIPLTYPPYETLKPLTEVSPGTYTSQDFVESETETPETSSYQSFGPLTEVFTVHYPQYENIEPISELYPLYGITVKNELYEEYPPLKEEPYEEYPSLKEEPYENLDAIEPFIAAQTTTDTSYGAVEYFAEIPPPSNYSSNDSYEPQNELPPLTNSYFDTAAPWTNFHPAPTENMHSNFVNDNNYLFYENNGAGRECFPNTTLAYRPVDSSSSTSFGPDELLTKVPNPNNEYFLEVNNKTQNVNTDSAISKPTPKRKTKGLKGTALKLNSELKTKKPKKKKETLTTTKTKAKIETGPYYDVIKAKPFSPTIKLYNKSKKPKSEYDIQRLKSVCETLKLEAESATKKKSDIIRLRSEHGTFKAMSEEDRLLNADKKRQRLGEKYTRLKKSIQRVTGLSYRNRRGVIVPDKSLKIGTCSCPLECYKKISDTEQRKVFNEFHTLTTFKKQEEYIFELIKIFRKGNTYSTNSSKRKHTLRYHIQGSNGKDVIVCKEFFKKTLVISDGRISRVLKRRPINTDDLPFVFDYDENEEELN